jgi:murein DD-endopeptidase MepM/ murein hydrolase activator NlpD
MRRRLSAFLGSAIFVAGSGIALGVPLKNGRDPAPAPISGDLDVMLKQYDAEEQQIQTELDDVARDLKETDARIVWRGRSYYKATRVGLLPAGNGFDELVDHAAMVERTRLALVRDLEHEVELHKQEKQLNDRLSRVRADRVPLEVHRQAMSEARSALQQEQERRAAFGRAFDSSSSPPGSVAIYGADTGPASDGGTPFDKLYGHLPVPITGRSESRVVPRQGSDGPGVEFLAQRGAVARSVAAGRVTFAAKREGDDMITVVLDHGQRYSTLYGNLASTDLKVGDAVVGNTAIGPVGARYGEGPLVYFEVRKNGDAVDPGPWLGL